MTTTPLRLGFAGTPDFAATILDALIASEHELAVVYTQPDRRTGRGRKVRPSPVKEQALGAGLPVEQPLSLRGEEAAAKLQSYRLDALIVAAYGLLLPPSILSTPTHGCINVHASLLPRWRGAAPIERAVLADDAETGVAIMQMDKGLDTGPVFADRSTPITETTTAAELHDRLAVLGAELLVEVLSNLSERTPAPQDDALATLAPKITEVDSVVNLEASAESIARQVRALAHRQPPTLINVDAEPVRLRLLGVSAEPGHIGLQPGEVARPNKRSVLLGTGSGALSLETIALSVGKGAPMPIAAAVNGYPQLFTAGSRWQSAPL